MISTITKPPAQDTNDAKDDQKVVSNQTEVVRICVLGATGVGKSTLCNFISNDGYFKTADGPISCTKQCFTLRFFYTINGKKIQFEITDTPGWFDINNGRDPRPEIIIEQINKCIKISQSGITAFFIVVPYERLSIDIEQSINFMRNCFDTKQLQHVYMVFTKCKKIKDVKTILNTFKQQKENEKAAELIYDYSQAIKEKCFATECEFGDEKELSELRKEILTEMKGLYDKHGVTPDGIFQVLQRNHQQQLQENQRELQRQMEVNQRELEKIEKREKQKYIRKMKKFALLSLGTVALGSCAALKGYMKYKSLVVDNSMLKNDNSTLKNNNCQLKNGYNKLQSDVVSLQGDVSSLERNNIQMRNENSSLLDANTVLTSNNSELQKINEVLGNNNNSLKNIVGGLNNNVSALLEANTVLTGNNMELKKVNETVSYNNKLLENNNNSLKYTNNKLHNDVFSLQQRENQLQNENVPLVNESGVGIAALEIAVGLGVLCVGEPITGTLTILDGFRRLAGNKNSKSDEN